MATAAFNRLSGLVDQAVTALGTAANGTSDTDLNSLSDKLSAALSTAPTPVVSTGSTGGISADGTVANTSTAG